VYHFQSEECGVCVVKRTWQVKIDSLKRLGPTIPDFGNSPNYSTSASGSDFMLVLVFLVVQSRSVRYRLKDVLRSTLVVGTHDHGT
jgi:hypothetical protein